jgi:hypothetical protein
MHRDPQLLSYPMILMERVGATLQPTVHTTPLLLLNHNSNLIHILLQLKLTLKLSLRHMPNSSSKLRRDRNKWFILEHLAGLVVLLILMLDL